MREEAPRRITLRLVRMGEDEHEFDDALWRELGPEARLEALWSMVLEADVWKDRADGRPRLQRSVLRIERR